MFLKWLMERYRANEERHRALFRRMQQAFEARERLRAELSHLEHEIYELYGSGLPRRQQSLIEAAIRVRCHRVESEMDALHAEFLEAWRAL